MLGSMTRVAAVAGMRVGAAAVAIMDVKVPRVGSAGNPELADLASAARALATAILALDRNPYLGGVPLPHGKVLAQSVTSRARLQLTRPTLTRGAETDWHLG